MSSRPPVQITALKEKALKIKMRIRSLRNKIAKTQKKSHQELLKSIDDKDMVQMTMFVFAGMLTVVSTRLILREKPCQLSWL